MESVNISFSVTGQKIAGCGVYCASNTVHYIIARFDLDDNWHGFDSVRAVWSNDFKCISTVLDQNGSCTVPHEVLERRGKVSVNLVGSILEDDELTDRLTTYPILAITVDANAKICGTETAEVTPSQFEQYIAQVIAEVEKVTGMTAVAVPLPEGSDPTASYEDGVLTLGIPKGEKGDTGNGIERVEFNSDYSLTFYFTESEPYTTPSIRGARGAQGYGIVSVEKKGSVGLVDTYQVNYENPEIEPTTFTVTNGAKGDTGNGIESAVLNDDYTLTLTFTDGTEYTTPSIRGEQGEPGEVTLAQFASAFPTDTASGAIASFPDGSDLFNYLSCVVDIEPLQDLHGYDKPWVGGAGVNKYNASAQLINTGASATIDGDTITATANNGALIVTGKNAQSFPAGTYTCSAIGTNADGFVIWRYTVANNTETQVGSMATARTFTADEPFYLGVSIASAKWGQTVVGKIQLETGSTATSWTPYENLCPITGWTGCEVDVSGVNLNPYSGVNYVVSNTRERFFLKAGTYTFSTDTGNQLQSGANYYIRLYDAETDGNVITSGNITSDRLALNGDGTLYYGGAGYVTVTFTLAIDAWVCFGFNNVIPTTCNAIQLEVGTSYSAYKPYTGTTYPVSWQTEAGTVYGGTVDLVTGVLTVDRRLVNIDPSTVNINAVVTGGGRYIVTTTDAKDVQTSDPIAYTICNTLKSITSDSIEIGGSSLISSKRLSFMLPVSTQAEARQWFTDNPTTVVYPLAQAQTYQLDPMQVACLLGQNNVWADCGSIEEVQYKADFQKWVEKQLREINTAILALS